MFRNQVRRANVAALTSGLLVVAACGNEAVEADRLAVDEPSTDTAPAAAPTADDSSVDGASATSSPVGTTPRGGAITVLLDVDSDTWDIPNTTCPAACMTVMDAVADPLLVVNDQGGLEPFLAESFSVSDDFTTWTITMREGVSFHDGTPVDGAAVRRNLIEMASGFVQGGVFWDLANGGVYSGGEPADSIELVDDMTVRVNFGRPLATFGHDLAGRTGWLMAPSYWDDPDRGGALAVSTGPFMMQEWVPGQVTRVVANPDYWRVDAEGAALPYLDEIEYLPVPEPDERQAMMRSGDADVAIDSSAGHAAFWAGDWLDSGNGVAPRAPDREIEYLLLNGSVSPFEDARMRRALAHCTDRSAYVSRYTPQSVVVDGPFAAGALGYLADPGFPRFDPDEGNRILDEIGRPEVFRYGTVGEPENLSSAEFFRDMWSDNCGLTVELSQFELVDMVTKAIIGDFDVLHWRNHGQAHPGLELPWWHSRHAEGLAVNFGRITDDDLDDLLFRAGATDDTDELRQVAEDINRRFADQVYNVWLNTTEWSAPYRAGVHGVQSVTLESGPQVVEGLAGRVWLQEVWLER